MTGKLYVVATPIGNLEDITLRAIRILKEVDTVFAEDTRVARKLLSHLGFSAQGGPASGWQKPVERFDEHVSNTGVRHFVGRILDGKNVAFVTDAGTPNISDPGWKLVKAAIEQEIEVIPIPGPSALTAALSIAHFPVNDFVFLGFPPAKKGRNKFFELLSHESRVVVLYESTHRILRTISELASRMPDRETMVAKELTKLHERTWRGVIGEITGEFSRLTKEELKGEFVIVLAAL